jgi:hypothetical protein
MSKITCSFFPDPGAYRLRPSEHVLRLFEWGLRHEVTLVPRRLSERVILRPCLGAVVGPGAAAMLTAIAGAVMSVFRPRLAPADGGRDIARVRVNVGQRRQSCLRYLTLSIRPFRSA